MDGVKPPDILHAFGVDYDQWTFWKRRFEVWLVGTGQHTKAENVKVNLFLAVAGPEALRLFDGIEWIGDEGKKLGTVIARFDQHFRPQSSEIMARHKFFKEVQGTLSIGEYVTNLKQLADQCNFGELRDSLMRDMLILHCRSEKLRECLLRDPHLDLKKAIEFAKADEEASQNMGTLSRDSALTSVQKGGQSKIPVMKGKSEVKRTQGQNAGFSGECYGCGKKGHRASDCRSPKKPRSRSSSESDDQANVAESRPLDQLLVASKKRARNRWYVDSGASNHMTNDIRKMEKYTAFERPRRVQLAGSRRWAWAYGKGEVAVKLRVGDGKMLFGRFTETLFVPSLRGNIYSVGASTRKGLKVTIGKNFCQVKTADGAVVARGSEDGSGICFLHVCN